MYLPMSEKRKLYKQLFEIELELYNAWSEQVYHSVEHPNDKEGNVDRQKEVARLEKRKSDFYMNGIPKELKDELKETFAHMRDDEVIDHYTCFCRDWGRINQESADARAIESDFKEWAEARIEILRRMSCDKLWKM